MNTINTTKTAARHFVSLSGRKIDLLDPKASDITIHDICVGMATTNRWAGQTPLDKEPISCATHSLYVLDYIAQHYPDSLQQFPNLALSALLHDAHKAYMGQQPAAFANALSHKTPVPDQIRNALKKAIFTSFDLIYPVPTYLQKVITEAENNITAIEIRDFNIPIASTVEPKNYSIPQIGRMEAYDTFLNMMVHFLPVDYAAKKVACA